MNAWDAKANLTVTELIGYMNISRKKAYELVHDKSFYPAYRIGKKILINKFKLEKWIFDQTMETKEG